jgi:hypothetical protein
VADNVSLKAKLNSLDDMQLYNLINTVALASGLDAKKANSLTSDIPKLRRMLSSLSDEQINTLLSMVSRGNGGISEIISRL